ncbi:MAG: hypothetical protein AB9869_00105 [Verrucomicrobiia bacterium]
MKKTAVAVAVLGVVLCAWLLSRSRPGGVEAVIETPAQEVSQPATEKPQPPKDPPLLPVVTIAETEEYVDLKRAEKDIAYQRGPLLRHTCIKQYLASPLKGDPTLESVIDFLLTNGFSIDDLQIAYVGLMLLDGQYPTLERMKFWYEKEGTPRELWEEQLERAREQHMEHAPRTVQSFTGIDDPALVLELLSIAPGEGKPLGPSRENIPLLEAVDGERLLTDADWMTERHRVAAAKGAGQPRRTMIKPLFDDGSRMERARLASEGWPVGSRLKFEKLR